MDEMKSLKKEMRLIISAIFINSKTIILFGILGFILSLFILFIPIDDMYSANSSVCSTLFNDNYDNTKSVRLMESFIDLFESSLIQNKIVEVTDNAVSADELRHMTTFKTSNSKTILTIITHHKNPSIAIKTANATAYVMIMETDKLYESSSGIKILDTASSAGFAYKGRDIHLLICFLLTFFFALGCCVYFVVKTITSDKLLFIEECTMEGSLEIMGVIPYSNNKNE